MTRRDYTLIAKVISGLRGHVEGTSGKFISGYSIRDLVCESFIDVLEKENGNFNEEKFRAACERK